MASGKKRTRRKRPAKKPASRPGVGHNKPPTSEVPPTPPPISSWQTVDETSWQIASAAATRQRSFIAATSSGTVAPVGPPLTPASDPSVLHAAMLRRIAALEETTARLPTKIKPRPLDERDIEEINGEIAKLKALPPVATRPPTDAVRAEGKLRKFAEKVVEALAMDAAKQTLTAGAKALWARYGDDLIALAQAIGEWIASLPPP